jgi:hypothetical protein
MMRTHVVMPRDVVETIDTLVGRRGRSKFLAEAAEEKLRRLRLLRAANEVAGSLASVDIPGWETPEAVSEWVRSMRRADQQHRDEVLQRD